MAPDRPSAVEALPGPLFDRNTPPLRLILAATDLTDRGNIASFRAGRIAAAIGAPLRLLHVIDGDLARSLMGRVIDLASERLAELEMRIREETGVEIDRMLGIGEAWRVILYQAERLGASLVVMGPHRNSGLADLFKGTTLERVATRCDAALLLARSSPHRPYRRAVVGTDFSVASRQALRLSLAVAQEAEIELLHVAPQRRPDWLSPPRAASAIAGAAEMEMRIVLRDLGEARGRVRQRIEPGGPGQSFRALVTRTRPDLLALGTHARAPLSEDRLGSQARIFLSDPTCDVLAVPPRFTGSFRPDTREDPA